MIGYFLNNRGNYKCSFCDHKSWKSEKVAKTHVADQHPNELVQAELHQEIAIANKKRQEAEYKALALEGELTQLKKPKKEVERYRAIRYCQNCLTVDSVSVPKGYAVGVSACFRCGTSGGGAVKQVNVDRGIYD